MKIIRKDQSIPRKNGENCTVQEYKFNDELISCVEANILGRYPKTGSVMNRCSRLVAYVHEGSGSIVIENQEIVLNPGDVVLVEPEEKYYWNGIMRLVVSCAPAWYPEQHVPC